MRASFPPPIGSQSVLAAVFLILGVVTPTLIGGEPPIVFASRFEVSSAGSEPVRKATIGRLLLLEEDRPPRVLVSANSRGTPFWTPKDVLDPDVSYDGRSVLFSGYSEREKSWRIFEVGVDGTGLRQITESDRSMALSRYGTLSTTFDDYDDLDPCYLPDGRICFVSTRYPGIGPNHRVRSTNLYVMNSDGADLHRITTERFGADTPAVDPATGQIVYARWWRSARHPSDAQPLAQPYFIPQIPAEAAAAPLPGVHPSALRAGR